MLCPSPCPPTSLNVKIMSFFLKCLSLSCVRFFMTPWTVARQASQSMEFSRQEHWSGLPCPSPGAFPNSVMESASPALQADSSLSETPGKPTFSWRSTTNVTAIQPLVCFLSCTPTNFKSVLQLNFQSTLVYLLWHLALSAWYSAIRFSGKKHVTLNLPSFNHLKCTVQLC